MRPLLYLRRCFLKTHPSINISTRTMQETAMSPFFQPANVTVKNMKRLINRKLLRLKASYAAVKPTCYSDVLTQLGLVCGVGAHAVVSPFVLLLHAAYVVGFVQLAGGLRLERGDLLIVVPGECDGRSAVFYGADERQGLPFCNAGRAEAQQGLGHWLWKRVDTR